MLTPRPAKSLAEDEMTCQVSSSIGNIGEETFVNFIFNASRINTNNLTGG